MIVERGAALFARFAAPPNTLGYCGPIETGSLGEAVAGGVESEVRRLAAMFTGAMPYLELLSACAGRPDVLSLPVVSAYWMAGPLLDRVDRALFGASIDDRFRDRVGPRHESLDAMIAEGRPSHAFHVFCVYPWVGMLRAGYTDHPLRVIEECRVGWGKVTGVEGGTCSVLAQPVTYDAPCLGLAAPTYRRLALPVDWTIELEPGDDVAFHWGTVAARLDDARLGRLRADTVRHIEIVNRQGRSLDRTIQSA